jgi:peptidoglycan/xylan/chitin deacetylase (PgdA/CDA1 family)
MRRSLLRRFAAALGMLLLPLSIVPLLAGRTLVEKEYASFSYKYLDREALPAPDVRVTAALKARFRPLPGYDRAVPVLTYHGINDQRDHYSISQKQFAEQMAMLSAARFHAISMEQYRRFLAGDRRGLPSRPILITFDDGRYDSFAGADDVLARHGFRATMFVIAGEAERGSRFYSSWSELRSMKASGRWDLELHAGYGHRNVSVDDTGRPAPYYANVRVARDGTRETFAAYRRRATADIRAGVALMRKHVPGYVGHSYALPYGDYGQNDSNDPRIKAFFKPWLLQRFPVIFTQRDPVFSTPRDLRDEARRYEVHTETTVPQLYRWLRSGLGFEAWTEHEQRAHLERVGAHNARCVPTAVTAHAAARRATAATFYLDGRRLSRDTAEPFGVRLTMPDSNVHVLRKEIERRDAAPLIRDTPIRVCR